VTLHVDPLEAVWFVTTLAGLILTLAALAEARRELLAVEALTGILREPRLVLTGQGNVRREALRSVVQALLLTVAPAWRSNPRSRTSRPASRRSSR